MDGDFDSELAELAALTAAHLRHELDMANPFLPRVPAPELASQEAPISAESVGTEPVAAEPVAAEPVAAEPVATPMVQAPSTQAPSTQAPSAQAPSAQAPSVPDDPATALRVIQARAAECTRCRLHEGRTKSVFARGSLSATVMFVGEGPGYHEDQQGVPFVGRAGQLLDKMIGAMGLGADEFYICNVVKCRPPENRTPTPDEAAACLSYLEAQIEHVAPRVIVALGRHAAHNLGVGDGRWRGRWGTFQGIDVMPTYHPAFLLRSPEQKRPVWQDLQAVLTKLGREVPTR